MAMMCTRTKVGYQPPPRIPRALNAVTASFVCCSGNGAGCLMALPAERWVADVRRSYSNHLGNSGIAPLHMPARGRSPTCIRRGTTFSKVSACYVALSDGIVQWSRRNSDLKNSWGFAAASLLPLRVFSAAATCITRRNNS